MKVLLKRNLVLGTTRYRASIDGTEIPDVVDEKKIVLKKDFTDAKTQTPLPHDAVMFDERAPRRPVKDELIKGQGKPQPVALSQLARQKDAVAEAENLSVKK